MSFTKLDWRTIATHDNENIKGFFGDFRFLSNFADGQVEFEGAFYPTSENAYQAAKVAPNKRGPFQTCSPVVSKKLWKEVGTIYSPERWDAAKLDIMRVVVFQKFLRNDGLRSALLLTQGKFLEETNWWKDTYWGVDNGVGENHLGKLLMATRAYFAMTH